MAQNRPQLVTFYGTIATVLRIVLLVPMVYYFGMMGVPLAYNAVVLVTILIVVFYVMPRMGLIRFGRVKVEVQQ